jgi:hypothetical protein
MAKAIPDKESRDPAGRQVRHLRGASLFATEQHEWGTTEIAEALALPNDPTCCASPAKQIVQR